MLVQPAELQSWLDYLSATVVAWNHRLCHPAVTVLQFQGAFLVLLLAIGWLWSGAMRLMELRHQQAHGAAKWATAAGQPHASGCKAEQGVSPGVCVVSPVKGCRRHSARSWQSQLRLVYDGPLEVIFVVDGKDDPAYDALSNLLLEAPPSVQARLHVSGHATSCSQKIHNLQAGIRAASAAAKYVLCLDDDVVLHAGALQMLVDRVEADPSIYMATGYPFDVPPPGSNLLTYCMLVFHMPLIIAFSIREVTQFVWGGCMLLPLADLRTDRYGLLRAWSAGGYSDDLIVASIAAQHRLKILCPSCAVFPQWLDGDVGVGRWWNYLRRQLYVLDTYASPANRAANHSLMAVQSYIAWAVVAPATTVSLRLLLWLLQVILLPSQQIYDGPGTSWEWLRMFGVGDCPLSAASLAAYLGAFALAAVALRWMTHVVLRLFDALAPQSDTPGPELFTWAKVALGFYIHNLVQPLCQLYTLLCPHVEWGGVRYVKRAGRVVPVDRPGIPKPPHHMR